MYIFELITQFIKGKKYTTRNSFDPLKNELDGLAEDSENCEHLFLPLDSSNEHFACKYCGLVVPKEKLKNKNIFENKSF
jgi:hypothetical protein